MPSSPEVGMIGSTGVSNKRFDRKIDRRSEAGKTYSYKATEQ